MKHPSTMGVINRLRCRLHVFCGLPGGHQLAATQLGQITPLDVLHGVVGLSFMFSHLEDRHDVWVMQPGGHFGFLLKALFEFVPLEIAPQQHFQGHHPVQTALPRPVNHPHAPARNHFQQLVIADVGDFRAWQRWLTPTVIVR